MLLPLSNNFITQKIYLLSDKLRNLKWKKRLQKARVDGAEKIFTFTTISELRALYNLALQCPQGAIALEIGSYLGASTCFIGAGLREVNGHLFCVDTWNNETMPEGEQNTFAEFQKNTAGVKELITAVRKKSEELDTSDIKVPLNFVFIDGDHSYKAAKHDFEKVSPWIVEGGIIAFHDCTYYESVSRVLGEVMATGGWQIGGNVDSLVWLRKVGKKHFSFPNPMNVEVLSEVV